MAVLPPFIDPARGMSSCRRRVLGAVQIAVCTAVRRAAGLGRRGTARFLGARPAWLAVQRWVLGAALGLLAVKLATQGRTA